MLIRAAVLTALLAGGLSLTSAAGETSPAVYTFEGDAEGAPPSGMTVLNGAVSVTSGQVSGWTGHYLVDPAPQSRGQWTAARFDRWSPESNQVLTFQFSQIESWEFTLGFVLRGQAGTEWTQWGQKRPGVPQGYLFRLDTKVRILKLAPEGGEVELGASTQGPSSYSWYRLSALGNQLEAQGSADGTEWISLVKVQDATFPKTTAKVVYTNSSWKPSHSAVDNLSLSNSFPVPVPPTGISIDQNEPKIVVGNSFVLTATVSPPSANSKAKTWSSNDPAIAKVSSAGVVEALAPGVATIRAVDNEGHSSSVKVTVQAGSNKLQVGINLMNIMWDGWTSYYAPDINWRKAKPLTLKGEPSTNVWNPQFLADMAIFTGPIRFMDWTETNLNPIRRWADRIRPTEDHYQMAYAPAGKHIPLNDPLFTTEVRINNGTNKDTDVYAMVDKFPAEKKDHPLGPYYVHYGVAYEWMIDLCNRLGRDMWVNIPYAADDDYVAQLAKLLRASLNPNLKVWVEYANETWNPGIGFRSIWWVNQQGKLAPSLKGDSLPGLPAASGPNGKDPYYLGQAYTVYRSLQIWRIFNAEFGTHVDASTPSIDERVIRVLCAGGGGGWMDEAVKRVMFDGTTRERYSIATQFNPTYNPDKQIADLFCTTAYVGADQKIFGSVGGSGASPTALSDLHNDVEHTFTAFLKGTQNTFKKYGFAFWGAYEGGNGTQAGRKELQSNPGVYQEIQTMLTRWKAAGLSQFNQYVLYNSSWGLKDHATTDNSSQAQPSFAAFADWLASH